AATFPAAPQGTTAGRGADTRGSENVITNGSKILVPQGYGLITVVDGRATGLITEAGGYEFNDQSPDARSVFAGDEFLASTVGTSWERFKFGGRPSSQQLAFYVSLKEIRTTASAPSPRSTGTTPTSTPRSAPSAAAPTRCGSSTRCCSCTTSCPPASSPRTHRSSISATSTTPSAVSCSR